MDVGEQLGSHIAMSEGVIDVVTNIRVRPKKEGKTSGTDVGHYEGSSF